MQGGETSLHARSGGTPLTMAARAAKGAPTMRPHLIGTLAFLVTVLLGSGAGVLAHEHHKQTVTVVNLNGLHGLDCVVPGVPVVAGTLAQQCRVTDRISLLFARLAALGCPDI